MPEDKPREGKPLGPGYLWRPGSSPQNNPLLLVVAIVITSVVAGAIILAVLTS